MANSTRYNNKRIETPSTRRPFDTRPLLPLALGLAISACSAPAPQSPSAQSDQAQHAPPAVIKPAPERQIEEVIVTAERRSGSTRRRGRLHSKAAGNTAHDAPQEAGQSSSYEHAIAHYPIAPPRYYPPQITQPDRERYADVEENAVKQVAGAPVSTFAIDVDTAAYTNARRQINAGTLPRAESVRVEEFINYFNYSYPKPKAGTAPFSITTEVGPSPWNSDRKLMLIGLQGYDIDRSNLPPSNLVFLIDVSGSMNNPQKLGLLKASMKMLTKGLRPQDTISIAVYAGAAGQVLAPTSGKDRSTIMQAIDSLHAGGSTNGGAGIKLAYAMAQQEFKEEGINRVILATDGDFNVGTTSVDALRKLIEKKRDTGVSLTVLGFGAGNYNDALMQELAQKGNGNAAYIDNINEARKVLVDEVGSTLATIAKDVKIQVEFNPRLVREYRLIGYETRALKREDFNNDRIDAGEIGAGHSVTALYELTLANAASPSVDDLRYGTVNKPKQTNSEAEKLNDELAHVKLRYKQPEGRKSKLLTRIVRTNSQGDGGDLNRDLTTTSDNFRFAAAASAFGALLSERDYTGDFDFKDALSLAKQARGTDEFGYRREFEQLLRTAAELSPFDPNVNNGAVSYRQPR